jgi:hypothetical protein
LFPDEEGGQPRQLQRAWPHSQGKHTYYLPSSLHRAPSAPPPHPLFTTRLEPGRRDGRFKVVQFNDTQDDEQTDRRTIEMMDRTLGVEKPDFVVINEDVINGGCDTELQVKQALNHVVQPMESRKIPWAVTFGTHDEDSVARTGMTEAKMLKFLQSYEFNVNGDTTDGVTGTSNSLLLVRSSKSKDPAFGLWLIDTGCYAPDSINGQDFEGYPDWDWVRMDPGPFNSGLFNAFLERGDVRGYFVGHDHVNTYVGNYYGVELGYAPGTGFGAYGLPGADRNRLRGARVFELDENHAGIYKETRLVFAKDLGIDLAANDQPITPLPLKPAQL